ncbi:MAG: adenosylcobinamide-phosphate synthase CbiB [Eubacteriales bacterium]
MKSMWIIVIAFLLDLCFGDPQWIYHPISIIGNMISKTEKILRRIVKGELLGGFILVLIITVVSFGVPFTVLNICYRTNYYLGVILEIFWCFQILATKSLKKAALQVYKPLKEGNIEEARIYISYIVGRDTQKLDEKGIIKATVETVAENTTDGVVAPLLFMAVGGAPLGFLYKAINTMDSMVGYKNERYILFGRCAAKLDDIANYIPARITAMFMILSAFVLNYNGKGAFKIYRRDRRNHKSPNSAQTESVCAGALDIQLAGNATYFGTLYEKPTIGDSIREIEPEDIEKSIRLMYQTSIITVTVIALMLIIIN